MPSLINSTLIGNWENWVRIFLMLCIGAVAVHFGQRLLSKKGDK